MRYDALFISGDPTLSPAAGSLASGSLFVIILRLQLQAVLETGLISSGVPSLRSYPECLILPQRKESYLLLTSLLREVVWSTR